MTSSVLLRRVRWAVVFFLLLWVANAAFSVWIGGAVVENARTLHGLQEAGLPLPAEPPQEVRRAAILLLSNLPLFVGLGWIVQGQPPEPGLAFHALAVFGGVYVPFVLALCLFFFLHPPSSPREFPGVEWDDGDSPSEESDRDER